MSKWEEYGVFFGTIAMGMIIFLPCIFIGCRV